MPVNVKPERVDPQYYNQGYYGSMPGQSVHMPVFGTQYGPQVGNMQQMGMAHPYQQGQQMGNHPMSQGNPALGTGSQPHPSGNVPGQPTIEAPKEEVSENQIDFASIKGVFGWDTVDGVNIPYIFRKEKKFVSVRVVEMKLLSRYPNSYPDDLGKHQPLTSYFITPNEARLLNEINTVHCGCEYGQKPFGTKDLIVLFEDFQAFYNLVKKTFPDNNSKLNESGMQDIDRSKMTQMCGWLQLNNTVSPFVKRPDGKYVPLSVIRYAAGLLLEVDVDGSLPSETECDLLNKACKAAGFNFSFGKTTRIISLTEIMKHCGIHITELPFDNPLQHAHYMELPTSQPEQPKTSPVPPPPVPHQMSNQMAGPSYQGLPSGMSPHLTAAFKQVQDKFAENAASGNRMHGSSMPPPMDPRYASMFMFGRNSMWPNSLYGCGMPSNTAMNSMNNCVPPNVALRPPHMNNAMQMYGMAPPHYMQNGQMPGDQNGPVRNMMPNQGNINRGGPSQSPSRSASVGSNSSGQMNRTSPALHPISHSPMGLQPSPTGGVRQHMSPPGSGRPPMSPVPNMRAGHQGPTSMNQGMVQGAPSQLPGTSHNMNSMGPFQGYPIGQGNTQASGQMYGPQHSPSAVPQVPSGQMYGPQHSPTAIQQGSSGPIYGPQHLPTVQQASSGQMGGLQHSPTAIQQALQQQRFPHSSAMMQGQIRPTSQQRFPSQVPQGQQQVAPPNQERPINQNYPIMPPTLSLPNGSVSPVSTGQTIQPVIPSTNTQSSQKTDIQTLSPNGSSHQAPRQNGTGVMPPPPLIAAPNANQQPNQVAISNGMTTSSMPPTTCTTGDKSPQVTETVPLSNGTTVQQEPPVASPVGPVPTALSDKDPNNLVAALVASIQGVWLNEKSISCMHLNSATRNGKYCLVEAVGKLFFNGVSVSEFLFALQNVLDVPLATCTDEEEKAFIQYYSLPVTMLKCNKMIDLKDLESFYPQLSYMFPDKSGKNGGSPDKDINKAIVSNATTSQPNQTGKTHSDVPVSGLDQSNTFLAIPVGTLESLEPPGADVKRNGGEYTRPIILGKRPSVVTVGPVAKQPCKKLEGTIQKLWNQAETGTPVEPPVSESSEDYQVAESGVIVLD